MHKKRFFDLTDEETLPHLMEKSTNTQQIVTDKLGEQVRSAITEFLHALDRLDQTSGSPSLLAEIPAKTLYEAALTVMMRLLFLFSAEERGLLCLGEPTYDERYAVSTLCSILREDADTHGEDVLELRYDAWLRLLSLFRAIHGGINLENLHLPAYGGSLFDPDTYPFLEGRREGTSWKTSEAHPFPIDNRVILHMLGDLGTSFRDLDVEQIGHVYEGLLDRTAKRAKSVLLGLKAKVGQEPFLSLDEAEALQAKDYESLLKHMNDLTGLTKTSLSRLLHRESIQKSQKRLAHRAEGKLRKACNGDEKLLERVRPFAALLREDSFGMPSVVLEGSLYVTEGKQRRDTGTHYTPRALTEQLVATTLEPHVYTGSSEGLPRKQWKLRTPRELLSLKICDMTMGSGAFLVQTCRYLSERLLESWDQAEVTQLPKDKKERLIYARRLVADRCLYGVDNNPLAVEMAKLSLWLTTMHKERPFTFLDRTLRCGDALMGITKIEQLECCTLSLKIKNIPSETPLTAEKNYRIQRQYGDALVMAYLNDALVEDLQTHVFCKSPDEIDAWLEEQRVSLIGGSGNKTKQKDEDKNPGFTHPFHWLLEYPEVFQRENPGFDAIVGNPPFLGCKRMREVLGHLYRRYLVEVIGQGVRGQADLVAYFFLRAAQLIRKNGDFGLVATNTIAQGDTRKAGLLLLEKTGYCIRAAWPDTPWEGSATVCTSQVVVRNKGTNAYSGIRCLSGKNVDAISSFLKAGEENWEAKPLQCNAGIAYIGSYVLGDGFFITEERAQQWIEKDERNLDVVFPYLIGEDVASSPTQHPSRWIINFYDWEERCAKKWTDAFAQITNTVFPERQKLGEYYTAKRRKKFWWRYGAEAKELYHAIGRGDNFIKHPKNWKPFPPLERVLAISLVSKHGAFSFVPNTSVFAMTLVIFASSDAALFGILQTSFHHAWARKMGSTLETRFRYTPSSAFDTFPRPIKDTLDAVREHAEKLHAARAAIMQREHIGLTDLYNAIHDPKSTLADVDTMRSQHEQLDRLVALIYGLEDLDVTHDFRQVEYLPNNDNIRHTIAEPVRREVLRRLTNLNRKQFFQ